LPICHCKSQKGDIFTTLPHNGNVLLSNIVALTSTGTKDLHFLADLRHHYTLILPCK